MDISAGGDADVVVNVSHTFEMLDIEFRNPRAQELWRLKVGTIETFFGAEHELTSFSLRGSASTKTPDDSFVHLSLGIRTEHDLAGYFEPVGSQATILVRNLRLAWGQKGKIGPFRTVGFDLLREPVEPYRTNLPLEADRVLVRQMESPMEAGEHTIRAFQYTAKLSADVLSDGGKSARLIVSGSTLRIRIQPWCFWWR